MSSIKAEKLGKCHECNETINIGDDILTSSVAGEKHALCPRDIKGRAKKEPKQESKKEKVDSQKTSSAKKEVANTTPAAPGSKKDKSNDSKNSEGKTSAETTDKSNNKTEVKEEPVEAKSQPGEAKTDTHLPLNKPNVPSTPPQENAFENLIVLTGGEGYGHKGWKLGEVIQNKRWNQIAAGEPEILVVVKTEREYIERDGWAKNVGKDSGNLYKAYCRPATGEESRVLREKIEAARKARAALIELEQLAVKIRGEGEQPAPTTMPEGMFIPLDKSTSIKESKKLLILTSDHIWYIEHNDGEYDIKKNNNIRGAGTKLTHVGWRLLNGETLAQQVRKAASEVESRKINYGQ